MLEVGQRRTMIYWCFGEMKSFGNDKVGRNRSLQRSIYKDLKDKKIVFFISNITFIYWLCVGGQMLCTWAMVCVWRSEDNVQDSVFSSYHVGSRTQVYRLGGKHLHPQSRLDGPGIYLCKPMWGIEFTSRKFVIDKSQGRIENAPHTRPLSAPRTLPEGRTGAGKQCVKPGEAREEVVWTAI